MTIVPTSQPTIASAAVSLSTGARSSPWMVGSGALTSSADLASARLRFLGAKLAKSCSSMFSTNCQMIARIRSPPRMLVTTRTAPGRRAFVAGSVRASSACASSRPQ
jgi:hypothetical protein